MIKFREINGVKLGFGFDWKTAQTDNAAKTIKEECTKSGDKYSFETQHLKESGVSLYATTDDDRALKSHPAANLIYNSFGAKEDVIYFCKIPNDQLWVCCLYQGEIVSGGDIVMSSEELEKEFENFLENLGISNLDDFSIYADNSALDVEVGIDIEFKLDLSEIVNDLSGFAQKSRFKKVHSLKDAYIKGAIVLAAVAGIAWYMAPESINSPSNVKTQPVKKVSIDKLVKELPKNQKRHKGEVVESSIMKSDDSILREAREQEINWLNRDLSLYDEASFLDQLHAELSQTPYSIAGWKLSKVVFDISNPSILEYVYSKSFGGTALTIKKELKGQPIIYSPDGKIAKTLMPVGSITEADSVDFRNVSKQEHNSIQLMHDLDVRGMKWSISPHSLEERPQVIEGLKNVSREKERQLKLDAKDLIVKGKYLAGIKSLSEVFKNTDKFLIERIVVNIDSTVNWSVYGVYYNDFAN